MGVGGIGFADGGDNIAVYIPLFAAFELDETMVVAGIFLAAVGLWVLFARIFLVGLSVMNLAGVV